MQYIRITTQIIAHILSPDFFSRNPYLISSVPPCNICQGAGFPMTKSTQFFQHRLNGSAFAQQVLPTFVRVIDLQFEAQKKHMSSTKAIRVIER